MRGNWKRYVLVFVVFATAILQVTEVKAIWPFRRRARNDGYSYSGSNYRTSYGTTGTYGAGAGMAPSATVTAPGVGVSAGPTGYGPAASVSAPGVGVNAGPGGANVSAPGVGVNAGAGARTGPAGAGANLRGGADANIRVRGQTPETQPPSNPAP